MNKSIVGVVGLFVIVNMFFVLSSRTQDTHVRVFGNVIDNQENTSEVRVFGKVLQSDGTLLVK
jgi:hypothetical protein